MKHTLLAAILIVCMISCAYNDAKLYGVGETHTMTLGTDGTSANTVLGNSFAFKASPAFQALMTAITTYGAAWLANDAYKMAQATTQMQNLGLSKQAIAQIQSQTQLGLAAQKGATTQAGITGNLFTPQATVFKQP